MNRSNIWIHIGLAVVLISFAAVLGRIDRMATSLKVERQQDVERVRQTNVVNQPRVDAAPPEVLVRFKQGTTLDRIREIAFANNDRVDDEIEAVNGLVVIDDLDDADAETVANQYSALSNVEYAEVISSSEASLAPRADGRLGAIGFVIPNRRTICAPACIPTCSSR